MSRMPTDIPSFEIPQRSLQTPPPAPPRRPGNGRNVVVAAALAAVLGGGVAAATVAAVDGDGSSQPRTVTVAAAAPAAPAAAAPAAVASVNTSAPVQPANPGSALTINQIYQQAGPGVVLVRTESGEGSGFVVDTAGYILTNAHVVDGAQQVLVSFSNNDKVQARIVGIDNTTDIALLKVNEPASALVPIPLGSSTGVKVGDGVVAIGNPFGLERTVTSGIVSALSRQIDAPNGFTIDGAIQTDAAINHGNSGGPLLNMQGQVIGINAQIADSGVNGNVGVGFAIPSDLVKKVYKELRDSGVARHAWIGISLTPVDKTLADNVRGVPVDHGVMVVSVVSGSPAASAGLRAASDQTVINGDTYGIGGDIIVAVDGKEIATPEDLQTAIDAHQPGDRVTLGVVRADGSRQDVPLTLGDKPQQGIRGG